MGIDERLDQSVGIVSRFSEENRYLSMTELSLKSGGGFNRIERHSAADTFFGRQRDGEAL